MCGLKVCPLTDVLYLRVTQRRTIMNNPILKTIFSQTERETDPSWHQIIDRPIADITTCIIVIYMSLPGTLVDTIMDSLVDTLVYNLVDTNKEYKEIKELKEEREKRESLTHK